MDDIKAREKSISDLLANATYRIDYYQREYRWEASHAYELIDDLATAFHEAQQQRPSVASITDLGGYFLGSIIVIEREGIRFLVDGQQRLTTLTLTLIAIMRRLQEGDQRTAVSNLIMAYVPGSGRTYKLSIEDRQDCMDNLYAQGEYDGNNEDVSIQNLVNRYDNVVERLEERITDATLSDFADWLMTRVMLVEITALREDDAYRTFETMNDRGLRLSYTEMLRGFLLTNIDAGPGRDTASDVWKNTVASLATVGRDEDEAGIRAWFRGQFGQSAEGGDYDEIGGRFHRWAAVNAKEKLGLESSSDYERFITRQFAFHMKWYQFLRETAEGIRISDMPSVRYLGTESITTQYLLHMAALSQGDDDETAHRKIRAVATYLDILIHRRVWNGVSISQRDIRELVYSVARAVRGLTVDELVEWLCLSLNNNSLDFMPNARLSLTSGKKTRVRLILARITEFVETSCGRPSIYEHLIKSGADGYHIEHIWPDHYDYVQEEYEREEDFAIERNWLGGLVLLPGPVNQSLNDQPYEVKRQYYVKDNLLAASLYADAYDYDPKFADFREVSGLEFHPYDHFDRAALKSRQKLYAEIASKIWDVERIVREARSLL